MTSAVDRAMADTLDKLGARDVPSERPPEADKWYPRSFYAPRVSDDHDREKPKLEQALVALVNVADYCRWLSRRKSFEGIFRKAEKDAREWESLYHKVLKENAHLVEAEPDAVELVQVKAKLELLNGTLAELSRTHEGMMQDRANTHAKWEASVEETQALAASYGRLMQEHSKTVAELKQATGTQSERNAPSP